MNSEEINRVRDEKLDLLDRWYRRSIYNFWVGVSGGLVIGMIISLIILAAWSCQ